VSKFYLANSGRVLIDGHDIKTLSGDSLHHHMGIVLQQNFLVLRHGRGERPVREASCDG
jgi:ABC-type multidrug transport system fused ATPase/permease subunit